jgi:hypothetical protein
VRVASTDNTQRAVPTFQSTLQSYNFKIQSRNQKAMALEGKYAIQSKCAINKGTLDKRHITTKLRSAVTYQG